MSPQEKDLKVPAPPPEQPLSHVKVPPQKFPWIDPQVRYRLWQTLRHLPLPWRFRLGIDRWSRSFLFPELTRIFEKDEGPSQILFVSETLPFPDLNSGDLRLSNILKATIQAGFQISFVSVLEYDLYFLRLSNPKDIERYEESIRVLGIKRLFYGVNALEKELHSRPGTFRSAFVSFPQVAEKVIPVLKKLDPGIRIIYDMVDSHSLRFRREATLTNDPAVLRKADRYEKLEASAARSSDMTIAVSTNDQEEILRVAPGTNVSLISNYFDIPPQPDPVPKNRSHLLFVGGFRHIPNIDAVEWFVREVFPLIRRSNPDLIFQIAGSNTPQAILELSNVEGIIVHGWVPDLSSLFQHSRVFVAPLRYGAGVKGKIGQALSFGLPVVTTSIGAEGLDLITGLHCEIADTPQEIATAVNRLLIDDAHWTTLSKHGREHIVRNFSTEVLQKKIVSLFSPEVMKIDQAG